MNRLDEVLEDYNNWIKLEIQGARPLEGSYLKAFQNIVGLGSYQFREIFFNKTSLFVVDADDYEELKRSCPDLQDAFRMESKQLNINIYVLSFVENKKLNVLLGGTT